MTKPQVFSMRRSLLIFFLGLGLSSIAKAESEIAVEQLSMGDLDPYFSSIHPQDGGFAFKRTPGSRPLVCQIGSSPAFVSGPGSVFEVKFGSHFRLFDKHSEIKFLAYGTDKGLRDAFLVEEVTLHGSTVASKTIHVGLIRTTPYSTHMSSAEVRAEVWPLPGKIDANDLARMERDSERESQ
jgi:hypothetical protein